MTCPDCSGEVTLETARHCPECGSPLPIMCGICGCENPAGSKFCAECGGRIRQAIASGSATGVEGRSDAPKREAIESRPQAARAQSDHQIDQRAETTAPRRMTTRDATRESGRRPVDLSDGAHGTLAHSAALDPHWSEGGWVSPAWRRRFALIEKAGGPKLPQYKQLSLRERLQLVSYLGLLLGPFYYLAKGMWRKALTLTAIGLVVGLVLEPVITSVGLSEGSAYRMSSMVVPAICATRANIDYYKKICLGQDGWI